MVILSSLSIHFCLSCTFLCCGVFPSRWCLSPMTLYVFMSCPEKYSAESSLPVPDVVALDVLMCTTSRGCFLRICCFLDRALHNLLLHFLVRLHPLVLLIAPGMCGLSLRMRGLVGSMSLRSILCCIFLSPLELGLFLVPTRPMLARCILQTSQLHNSVGPHCLGLSLV